MNLRIYLSLLRYRQLSATYRSVSETLRNMIRNKKKLFSFVLVIYIVLYFTGISDYVVTRSFDNDFDYPLNVDLQPVIKDVLAGKSPGVRPINSYPYKFLSNWKCKETGHRSYLVILVKSAIDHFGHRATIRATYGRPDLLPGRIIKTLFFLGINAINHNTAIQFKIEEEMEKYNDIIQMDFHDNYFNNTIKTMMMFKWAFENCYASHYYLFTDDDMYISIPKLLTYINRVTMEKSNNSIPKIMGDTPLFAGYVFKSAPQRFFFSKWRVSFFEYPWDKWPTYVTAGAYVVSNKSLREMFVASLFVEHFRFDDIYLGIIAKKIGLEPTHCDQFYYYKKPYSKEGYKDVIVSHGYSDHDELMKVWTEQHHLESLHITITPVSLT